MSDAPALARPAGEAAFDSGGLELVETPCPACGDDAWRAATTVAAEPPAPRGPWRIVRCARCDSDYLRPRPLEPARLYARAYHVHAAAGRVGGAVRRAAARLEALRAARLLPPGGSVYEVGCGTGELLLALRRRGFAVSGIELSVEAARRARARGLAVDEGEFAGGKGVAGGYDLVLAAHVLEHVPDPLRFLEDVRRILRRGGRALLKLPVAGSWDQELLGGYSGAFDVPYHLFVPSREALRVLARAAGLEVERERGDLVPNDWVHGIRRWARGALGLPLPFLRPWNPLAFLPLLPLSVAGAAAGAPGRLRLVLGRRE